LKGFFDSEGSMSKNGKLTASNSNRSLLNYVRKLLEAYFKIYSTGPHLDKRRGSVIDIRGKTYYRSKDTFQLLVLRDSLVRFSNFIDFTIKRKQEALRQFLGILSR
jgi:intein-encoded DNA endonuclease-like protein